MRGYLSFGQADGYQVVDLSASPVAVLSHPRVTSFIRCTPIEDIKATERRLRDFLATDPTPAELHELFDAIATDNTVN